MAINSICIELRSPAIKPDAFWGCWTNGNYSGSINTGQPLLTARLKVFVSLKADFVYRMGLSMKTHKLVLQLVNVKWISDRRWNYNQLIRNELKKGKQYWMIRSLLFSEAISATQCTNDRSNDDLKWRGRPQRFGICDELISGSIISHHMRPHSV